MRHQNHEVVAIFDPALATLNLGDEIIADAVYREVSAACPKAFLYRLPTHERYGVRSYRVLSLARYRFLGGSNLISPQMLLDKQWKIRPWDVFFTPPAIGLGIGGRKYDKQPDLYTKLSLKRLMNVDGFHSVRDKATKDRLCDIGIENVLWTACVTMWELTDELQKNIPCEKSDAVITTVNAGSPSNDDQKIADLLCREYQHVFTWPQGMRDARYLKELYGERATMLEPTLKAYDNVLREATSIEFVGNRLHGGIRALQQQRRTLVLSIDERAREIGEDTGLPVVDRSDITCIEQFIRSKSTTTILLPWSDIERWRNQFKSITD